MLQKKLNYSIPQGVALPWYQEPRLWVVILFKRMQGKGTRKICKVQQRCSSMFILTLNRHYTPVLCAFSFTRKSVLTIIPCCFCQEIAGGSVVHTSVILNSPYSKFTVIVNQDRTGDAGCVNTKKTALNVTSGGLCYSNLP